MKRIMIIGSPGSGKSTLARRLADKLKYPILHLDRIYHIDNDRQVSKRIFRDKIKDFVKNKDHFIIDGNYRSTIDYRMAFVDTIIAFDMDTEICLENIKKRRLSVGERPDMASDFDESIVDQSFIEYVKNFKKDNEAYIESLKDKYYTKKFYIIKDYIALERFIDKMFVRK